MLREPAFDDLVEPVIFFASQETQATDALAPVSTLHNIKDFSGYTDTKGDTTFGSLGTDSKGEDVYFFQVAKTYDWVNDDGYNNFGNWVAEAAEAVGR